MKFLATIFSLIVFTKGRYQIGLSMTMVFRIQSTEKYLNYFLQLNQQVTGRD